MKLLALGLSKDCRSQLRKRGQFFPLGSFIHGSPRDILFLFFALSPVLADSFLAERGRIYHPFFLEVYPV